MALQLENYSRILDTCVPYLVARPQIVEAMNLSPLGVPIDPQHVFNPQKVSSGSFLNVAKTLDAMTYGPLGLQMPDWVFYDCAVVPGAIFGFARPAKDLEPWLRSGLKLADDYDGLVPVSLFIAIPTPNRKRWIGYTLCSINEIAAGGAPEGLWRLTLGMGTAALGIERMRSTTRWRTPGLGVYASMGPLELVTAWTPAHDVPETITFDLETDDAARNRLLSEEKTTATPAQRYLCADEPEEMVALQKDLEEGKRWAIVGPAEIRGAETRIPLADLNETSPQSFDSGAGFRQRFQG
jgi:hypothetical protein